MTARRLLLAALAAVAVAAAALALSDDPDRYTVKVPLDNAGGLRDGSAVRIGGVQRGTVELDVDDRDRVIATIELDEGAGPLGRDARIQLDAANFLGTKRIEITPGDAARRPVPDGGTLPAEQVTVPTDLDQVLAVLDADTRVRAQVLIDQLGAMVVGRQFDLRSFLRDFPIGLEDISDVLRALKVDDATMRDLVVRSDRLVAEFQEQRQDLGRMVATVGETAETVAARRTQLRRTLAAAPGTLRELRGLLADVQATAGDLGPAATQLRASAGPLTAALREIEPFSEAAAPALDRAVDVAPKLTSLAKGATPVLRQALPTAESLSTLARTSDGAATTLDGSSDNIITVLENWSRAIQFRDAMGHVFRGEASYSPDMVLAAVDRMTKRPGKARRTTRRRAPERRAPAPAARAPQRPKRPAAKDLVAPVKELVDKLPEALRETLDELPADELREQLGDAVGGLTGKRGDGDRQADPGNHLLDFLLGR